MWHDKHRDGFEPLDMLSFMVMLKKEIICRPPKAFSKKYVKTTGPNIKKKSFDKIDFHLTIVETLFTL